MTGDALTVVALADTHLRSTDERAPDRLDAWDRAIEAGLRQRPDLWVHAGDVFDAKSSIEDRMAAADRLDKMADVAPVVIVKGNHDADGDLDIFGRLDTEYPILVLSAPAIFKCETRREPLRMFALPYPQRAKLVDAGVPHEQLAAEIDKAMDGFFATAALRFREAEAEGTPCLMVGHGTIGGAVTSVGQPMVGQEIGISPVHLARLGSVPMVFGHIHKPQEVHGAHYAGSLCRLDYGETEEKSILVVRWQGRSGLLASVEGYSVERIPIACPARYHVEATMTRDAFTWEVRRGPDGPATEPPASWEGHDVRVRVRYPEQERAVLQTMRQVAAEPFRGARSVDVEPIAIHQREVRAPEVAAARTLDEKLAAWARLSGVAWSETLAERARELLDVDDGEALVKAVAERIEALVGQEVKR